MKDEREGGGLSCSGFLLSLELSYYYLLLQLQN